LWSESRVGHGKNPKVRWVRRTLSAKVPMSSLIHWVAAWPRRVDWSGGQEVAHRWSRGASEISPEGIYAELALGSFVKYVGAPSTPPSGRLHCCPECLTGSAFVSSSGGLSLRKKK